MIWGIHLRFPRYKPYEEIPVDLSCFRQRDMYIYIIFMVIYIYIYLFFPFLDLATHEYEQYLLLLEPIEETV